MKLRIPFNKPSLLGREQEYMAQVVHSGHWSGDGPFTKACEKLLSEQVGARRTLLTSSCTDALEMAALLLGCREGDEVIMPAFTFVSTANAFALRGARPVFADIRRDTLNIDERQVASLITPRTRAIVVVHYAGVGCEMPVLSDLARKHGLMLIEDNAHGLFGRYQGKPLGSFGQLATQSFHETKNVTCGEGGALVINDEALIERAEILREKGTNRSRFFRGQVDKYGWVDLGSSFLPSEISAAMLLGQLEQQATIQSRRKSLWDRYAAELGGWAASVGATLPVVPDGCDQAFHMFYLVMPTLESRQRLIAHLKERGILAVFHYLPLNQSEMAKRLGADQPCPVTEDISDRLVRLPFFASLEDAEQADVIEAVRTSAVG